MKAECFATVMAGSLACRVTDADWHFSIRRVDGKTYGSFFDFHEKEVSASDIAKFIPNIESLQWTEIKNSILGKSESYTTDQEFKINVQSTEGGSKNHKQVEEAFLKFMRNAT